MTSALEVWAGSALLALAVLPLGLVILRGTEWVLRHRFSLSSVERAVFAFYGAGAALFCVVSVPIPIYGLPLVTVLLTGGAVIYAAIALREKGRSLRSALRWLASPIGSLLALGTLGLLAFEISPIASHPFPNAWDGSSTGLWMNLTLRNGTVPTSLVPFASTPVIYPMGATVWMTLPVLVLGWPLLQTPVWLPSLFLALTVPSAYCWGTRWGSGSSVSGSVVGVLFAAFFGVLASWPRFYTGGSYDFAFALPLFLVAVGLLPSFVRIERPSLAQVFAFGLLAGVLASLGLAAAETMLILLLGYSLVVWRRRGPVLFAWLGRFAIVVAFEVVFTLRSVVAWATYHPPGNAPFNVYGGVTPSLVQGELNPFAPWQFKMSPFWLPGLELQILLLAGLVLAVLVLFDHRDAYRTLSLSRFAADLLVGTTIVFVLTAVLLYSAVPGPAASGLRGVTDLEETSFLLFVFFEAICAFPLIVAVARLTEYGTPSSLKDRPRIGGLPDRRHGGRASSSSPGLRVAGIMGILVIVIPLATGAGYTLTDGPSYILHNVEKTSNVSLGDVTALEWIGNHLPSCSTVLVAPGSAGQFLPEYAVVHLVFPMNPVPQNQSYNDVVANLTAGQYSTSTRAGLEALVVTEVMVTAQTSVSYLPFLPGPLLGSPDFASLFSSGDALVLSFAAGVAATGCNP